ncbi:MAG: sugar phosphate isomerase/epimerase [Candidatus Bathyarchaeota archaeon]|nr:MAG: sugar phosphate isomerase/epimerase [Candidatus Bathyarchaeota archaeon]
MAKIDIGLSMLHWLGKPFSSLCQRLREVAVQHIELIDDGWHALSEERVRQLKNIGDSQGLIYTMHAPFANINIAAPAEDMRNFILKRLEKSMDFAGRLECRLLVIHPGLHTGISSFYPDLDWKVNIESAHKLVTLSRKHGVELALENCPEPYGFLLKDVIQLSRFFNDMNEEIGLVLDVGHSNINGQTRALMETFSKKIVHIHAHDNDGKHDLHLGVGHGTVDWQQFAVDIKRIRYGGLIMVESYSNIEESIVRLQRLLK